MTAIADILIALARYLMVVALLTIMVIVGVSLRVAREFSPGVDDRWRTSPAGQWMYNKIGRTLGYIAPSR